MGKQILHQSLQQKLSPQQIQLMKLIELSTLEIEQKVKEEIETNPALDDEKIISENEFNDEDEFNDESELSGENDFDIEQYLSDDETPDYKLYSDNYSKDDENESNIPIVGGVNHLDLLNSQLSEHKLSENDKKIAQYIIGCIDEDGYIRRSIDEIIDDLVFKYNIISNANQVEKNLSLVQSFDPPGIAALNLQQCLTIQLSRKARTPSIHLANEILNNSFNKFVNKHYKKICDQFKIDEGQLKLAIKEIEKLNPKPASNSSQTRFAQQIIPDFAVTINNDEINFTLNSRNAPSLKISKEYKNMLEMYKENDGKISKKNQQALSFLKQKLDSAKWFIDAINQRQQTLVSTISSIIKIQKKYFLTGDERDLKPMILKDVSEDVSLDISTISRVINSKYVETPYGIKSLKFYFSESISKIDGETISVKEVKSILKELIKNENSQKPLNDQALVDTLKLKGYKIARRTVAKYREQLLIPVARLRKKI